MECALKACLVLKNEKKKNVCHHNLVQLAKTCVSHGFQLHVHDFAMIVHLSHWYYEDLATGTKYKTRYPTETAERMGGTVPPLERVAAIIRSMVEQAEKKAGPQMQEMFGTVKIGI